jgi:hemerythrin superfamily protein
MNVIDLLTQDHAEVDELFRRVNLSEKPETLDELARGIVRALAVHAAVEEQFVYPLIRHELDDGRAHADEAIEEHQRVKQLLADLEKQEPGSSEHSATLQQVIDEVRHHVEEEEAEIFPKLREATDAKTLERLGTVVEEAKKVVPTHPHPLVPGTATAQLVAGPWAAMVDRVRDVIDAR